MLYPLCHCATCFCITGWLTRLHLACNSQRFFTELAQLRLIPTRVWMKLICAVTHNVSIMQLLCYYYYYYYSYYNGHV